MSQEPGSWYVRSRGRTLGPFSWPQLESLRDRGQLAQFHEVSQDKRSWVSASTLREFFGDRTATPGGGSEQYAIKNPLPPNHGSRDWFYQGAAGPVGPVSAEQLGALARSAQVFPETLI